MAESERSELEEKFVHLQVKSQVAENSVFESVPTESVAHDGAHRRSEDLGAAESQRAEGTLGRSASVKGFTQSEQSCSFAEAMEHRKSVVDAESDYWEKAPGTQEVVHSAPELEEFFIGEEEAPASAGPEVVEEPGPSAALPDKATAGGCSPGGYLEGGSGGDSPVKLVALSLLGSKLAAAASLSPLAAEPPQRDEHDPFEEFNRSQQLPETGGKRAEERLKKMGDFARSTSRSFFDWTAKAEVAKDRLLEKLDGAPEKIQDWKQRTSVSFDRVGEKLEDFVTRVDSKLESHANDFTDRHVPRLMETSERVSQDVRQAFENTSQRVSQDVRQAFETTTHAGADCQAAMPFVELDGPRTGDEMTDVYLSRSQALG